MKHFKTTIILCIAIILGTASAAIANAWMTNHVDGANTVESGCVIRFSNPDGSPSIHANAAHQCAGVESVGITSHGTVRVTQTVDDPARYPILSITCQTDETLGGQRGMICGASGGTGDTDFWIYDTRINRKLNLNNSSDRMRVQGKNANLWVGWTHAEN